MKIRSGFVSNSSSSSFMAIVRYIDPEKVTEENKDRIRISSRREFGEGLPYWTPTNEELKFLKEARNPDPFFLVEELTSAYDGDTLENKKELLPTIAKISLNDGENYEVMVFEKSYHEPDNIKEYFDED